MIRDSFLTNNTKKKKCFITECKQKAEFVAVENGRQIQLCPMHYERHENKHKKFDLVNFKKASEI